MFFKSNIQFLRKRSKLSQEQVATELGVNRSAINNYEHGYAEPSLEMLPFFSKYYKFSIDTLININLSRLSESQLAQEQMGSEAYVKGDKLRVLVSTVDRNNNDNIELVPLKAKAGYTAGFNDPEYIQALPTFQLPFLTRNRKYRTFQISGDSMLPIPDKSYVTTEYVEDWREVKDGHAYVVLTQNDGIVFKVVFNQIRTKKKLLLRSLNSVYEPYEVDVSEVKEVWKFINYMSQELPETPESQQFELASSIANLKEEIKQLREDLADKKKSRN